MQIIGERMFSWRWSVLSWLATSSAWAVTLTPTFTQNFCPVVIENNSGLPANSIYFVAHGVDNQGIPCFLIPDPNTGQCTYAYPDASGDNGSVASSVTLAQLPVAQGTAATGTAYLIYIPIHVSARAYLSINNPLFIETSSDPFSGFIIIGDPSQTALNDPNFYTLYQDIEYGFDESQTDSSTSLFMNVSYVDYFCLPMQLNMYSLGTNTPLVYGCHPYDYICLPAGTNPGTNRGGLINAINTTLSAKEVPANPHTWSTLGLFYYDNPYTDTATPSVYLRILAAKNSLGFGTGSSQFTGAANPQLYFPSTYTSNPNEGPSASTSFMQAVYTYYQSSSFEIALPAFGVNYTVSADPTNLVLDFKTTSVTNANMALNLANLTTVELLSGGNWTFTALTLSDSVNTAYVAELSKVISALFTLGSFPTAQTITDSQIGIAALNLDYFTNPYTTPAKSTQFSGGPWWNVYDLAIHLNELTNTTFTVPQSSSYVLGYGYGYDYDDFLNMSGLIGGFNFQDQYGNNPSNPPPCTPCPSPPPSCTPGSAQNAYALITLGNMGGMAIPNISQDTWTYAVDVGPASGGTAVSFDYYDSLGATHSVTASVSANTTLTPQPAVSPGKPFTVTFNYGGDTHTFSINLLHQAIIPTGENFSGTDRKYQAGITLTITNLNNSGKVPSGQSPQFLITYDSSPPPWSQ